MIPRGLMFDEVTASSLVKIDVEGSIVDAGTSNLGVGMDAFRLVSCVRAARSEIRCVAHLTSPAALAVCLCLI